MGHRTTTTPSCPRLNEEEWTSFYLMVEYTERLDEAYPHRPSMRPAVEAIGAIFQYCFPELGPWVKPPRTVESVGLN
jgi:hypothetical protein